MSDLRMVIDLDRCTGCHTCTVACQMEKSLPPDVALIPVYTMGGTQDVPQGRYPDLYMDYVPRPCAHCQNPPCVSSCPTEALHQREDGLVLVDASLCSGCEACLPSCPYGALVMDGDGVAHKCDLCASRLDQEGQPFCVICCPTRAISIERPRQDSPGWVPASHHGTRPTLRYLNRDAGRAQRINVSLGLRRR